MKIQPTVKNQKNHSEYIKFKNTLRNLLGKNLIEVEVPNTTPEIIKEKFLTHFKTSLIFAGEKTNLFLQPHPELYLKYLF